MTEADIDHRLDGKVQSDNVLDYDAVIVFLGGWSEIDGFEYAKEFGIDPNDVKRTSESILTYTKTIDFRGRNFAFNVILVNEPNFMERDSSCYGKLLLELVIYFASGSEVDRFPVEEYQSCHSNP